MDFRPERRNKYVTRPPKKRPTWRILLLSLLGLLVYTQFDPLARLLSSDGPLRGRRASSPGDSVSAAGEGAGSGIGPAARGPDRGSAASVPASAPGGTPAPGPALTRDSLSLLWHCPQLGSVACFEALDSAQEGLSQPLQSLLAREPEALAQQAGRVLAEWSEPVADSAGRPVLRPGKGHASALGEAFLTVKKITFLSDSGALAFLPVLKDSLLRPTSAEDFPRQVLFCREGRCPNPPRPRLPLDSAASRLSWDLGRTPAADSLPPGLDFWAKGLLLRPASAPPVSLHAILPGTVTEIKIRPERVKELVVHHGSELYSRLRFQGGLDGALKPGSWIEPFRPLGRIEGPDSASAAPSSGKASRPWVSLEVLDRGVNRDPLYLYGDLAPREGP